MCSAKCFLEVHNGGSGNNRIRQVVPVAYDSIAELILCNVTLKLRGLKFKTVTSGGDSRGRDFHIQYMDSDRKEWKRRVMSTHRRKGKGYQYEQCEYGLWYTRFALLYTCDLGPRPNEIVRRAPHSLPEILVGIAQIWDHIRGHLYA